MTDIEEIDRRIQGWGLQLDDVKIEKLLEHMLWECLSPDEFKQRCEFVFDNSEIALVWKEQIRIATIKIGNGKEITASV